MNGEKISLLFPDKEHRIGELVIDAIIRESHELRAEVSEHPTESGNSFVDHLAQGPTTIQIEGIITNTPMTLIGATVVTSIKNYFGNQSNDIADQAFKKLEDIFAKRMPIKIATSLKEYDNMVLETLCIERGGGNSHSLHFRLTAKQVSIVEQKAIALSTPPKPKTQRAKPKQHLSKQASTPKPVSEDKQSFLNSFFSWSKN